MDLLLTGGKILTMDPVTPRAEALGIRFGKIQWIGSNEDARGLSGRAGIVLDLGGRTVLPGFVDTHNHFCMTAFLRSHVDCRPAAGCLRAKDVVDALRERGEKTPAGSWILGWGYASYLLEDRRELTREDLDKASTCHPICLIHVSVHGAVVNSLALKRLGYGRESPDPPGGRILRGKGGAPNGILQESAIMGPLFFSRPSIYSKVMAENLPEQRIQMMEECALAYNRLGIVCVHDPMVDPLTLRTFQEAQGRLALRLRPYVLNHWAKPLMEAGILHGFGSDQLRLGGIKIFLDGGMSSRTAALSRPYVGGGKGILNYHAKGIEREIHLFHNAGYRISVHAQGDRALEILIRAFERNIQAGNSLRHHIVHAGNITSSQMERAAALGLYVTSQANFFSLLGDGFMEAFGPKRSLHLYPFKRLLGSGVKLSLSSDSPVADPNPLVGLRDAVLRKTETGRDFGPQERLCLDEALPLYNREAAYFSQEEDKTGTISPGKWADLVVLDRDIDTLEPEELPSCRVHMTIMGGKVVHAAKRS